MADFNNPTNSYWYDGIDGVRYWYAQWSAVNAISSIFAYWGPELVEALRGRVTMVDKIVVGSKTAASVTYQPVLYFGKMSRPYPGPDHTTTRAAFELTVQEYYAFDGPFGPLLLTEGTNQYALFLLDLWGGWGLNANFSLVLSGRAIQQPVATGLTPDAALPLPVTLEGYRWPLTRR